MGSCPSPGPAPKSAPARACQSAAPRKGFLARISALQGDLTAPAILMLSVAIQKHQCALGSHFLYHPWKGVSSHFVGGQDKTESIKELKQLQRAMPRYDGAHTLCFWCPL